MSSFSIADSHTPLSCRDSRGCVRIRSPSRSTRARGQCAFAARLATLTLATRSRSHLRRAPHGATQHPHSKHDTATIPTMGLQDTRLGADASGPPRGLDLPSVTTHDTGHRVEAWVDGPGCSGACLDSEWRAVAPLG